MTKRLFKVIKLESGWHVKVYRTKPGGQTTNPDEAERYRVEDCGKLLKEGWKTEE